MIATGSMEPVDGEQAGGDPECGWRVWRIWDNRLWSIGKQVAWQPGENQARCLVQREHDAPAPSCHCGFWALRKFLPAMQLATGVEYRYQMGFGVAEPDANRTIAVGLIQGYGSIAVHGTEGFRAGLASVACIFVDAPHRLDEEHANLRRAVAEVYGVPCITLEAAISIGFLQEMGVDCDAIKQLGAWNAAGRPLVVPQPSAPVAGTQLTRIELKIARLFADGQTTAAIARTVGLNSRAVEFHLRRIIERLGPGRPPQRAA